MSFFDDDDPFQGQNFVPKLKPEETQSRLDDLGSSLAGGLGYVGDLLDKTFGTRAIRGTLGGHYREALSVLPGSDTLGLTNPKDRVSGKELLLNSGLIHEDPDFIHDGFSMNDALGIGAEMLLDPSMYVGAAIPKHLLRGMNSLSKPAGKIASKAIGFNPDTTARYALGETGRIGRALFSGAHHGTWGEQGQHFASSVFDPFFKKGRAEASQTYTDYLSHLDDLVKEGLNPELIKTETFRAAQGGVPKAMSNLIAGGLDPVKARDLIDKTSDFAEWYRKTAPEEQALSMRSKISSNLPDWKLEANELAQSKGLPTPFVEYRTVEYAPGSLSDVLKKTATGKGRSGFTGASPFQIKKENTYKGLGGYMEVNDLFRTGLAEGLSPLQMREKVFNRLTGHSPTAPNPWASTPWKDAWGKAAKQATDFSEIYENLLQKPEVIQKGLFSNNIADAGLARRLESARVQSVGKTLEQALKPESEKGVLRSISDMDAQGIPYERIPDFTKSVAMTHDTPSLTAIHSLASTHAIPSSIANDLRRIREGWKWPSSLEPIMEKVSDWTQNLKSNLTNPFPAFHTRNLGSGLFNMWRDQSFSPSYMRQIGNLIRGGSIDAETAAKLYPGMSIEDASKQLRNELIAGNAAFTQSGMTGSTIKGSNTFRGLEPGTLPTVGGPKRSIAQDVKDWLGGYIPEKGKIREQMNPFNSEEFRPVVQGSKLGNTTEDFIRGSHLLANRMKGQSPKDALQNMLRYQIDYENLSPFEQNVMRKIIPFYSFSRHNFPVILEDLANKPAKLSAAIRMSTNRPDNEFVPQYLGEGSAVNLGTSPEGFTRFISGFGLPYEDEFVKAAGSAMHGQGRRALQTLLGGMNPLLKYPLEQGFDTQLHTGRKLMDLKPNYIGQLAGELPQGLGLGDPGPGLPQVVSEMTSATPFSRAVTAAGKLGDERKGTLAKMVNLLTGVNLTDVDVPRQEQIAVRDSLMSKLPGSPNAQHWQELNVPKEKLEKLSPEEFKLYTTYKALESKARADAKKKKKPTVHELME